MFMHQDDDDGDDDDNAFDTDDDDDIDGDLTGGIELAGDVLPEESPFSRMAAEATAVDMGFGSSLPFTLEAGTSMGASRRPLTFSVAVCGAMCGRCVWALCGRCLCLCLCCASDTDVPRRASSLHPPP